MSLETLSRQRRHKSRLSPKKIKKSNIRLYYDDRGLDKYYGLLRLGRDLVVSGKMLRVDMRWMVKKCMLKKYYKNPDRIFYR